PGICTDADLPDRWDRDDRVPVRIPGARQPACDRRRGARHPARAGDRAPARVLLRRLQFARRPADCVLHAAAADARTVSSAAATPDVRRSRFVPGPRLATVLGSLRYGRTQVGLVLLALIVLGALI